MAIDKDAKITVRGDASSAQSAFRQTGDSASGLAGKLASSADGIASTFARISGAASAMFALVAGAGFVVATRNAIDYQDATRKSAQAAGLSTEAYSGLAYAAKLADVESEALTKGLVKLGNAMVDVTRGDAKMRDLFQQTLKVDVLDAGGAIRTTDAVMEDLAERFASMEDGAKKTALAVEVFGEKAGPRLIPFLNQGKAGIAALRAEAEKFGLIVGGETSAQAEQFNDNLTRLKSASDGAANVIAQKFVPALANLTEFFVQATKDTNLWTGALITTGKVMADMAPDMLRMTDVARARDRYAEVSTELKRLDSLLIGVQNTLARSPGDAMATRQLATYTKRSQGLRAELLNLSAEIARLESGAADAGAGRGDGSKALIQRKPQAEVDLSSKAPAAPAVNRVPEFANVLAEQKKAFADGMALQEQYTEWGWQEESRYWAGILTRRDLSVAERRASEKHWLAAEAEIRKESSAARLADMQVQIESAKDNYAKREALAGEFLAKVGQLYGLQSKQYADALRAQLQIQREHQDKLREIQRLHIEAELADMEQAQVEREAQAQLEVELGVRTQESMLEVRRLGVQQRLELELKALDEEQAAYTQGTVEFERLEARKAAARRKATGQEAGLDRDKTKLKAEPLGSVMKTGEGAFSASLDAIIAKGRFAGAELGKIWRQAGLQMIHELTVKPLVEFAAMWVKKLALNAAGLASKNATEVVSAGVTVSTEASTGLASIGISAARAAAGAYAAIASIPVVGPVLAPIAAGVALAGVMALGKSMFSAEGGMDIPGGMNPIVQTHAREMILPARYADVIRGMAAGEGGGGGGGGTVQIQALDARSFERMLAGPAGDQILRALARRTRNGAVRF
jgi:hypothetical protein